MTNHPAEAATRENGDWVRYQQNDKRIGRGDDFAGDCWMHTSTREIRFCVVGFGPPSALSTRQQQGAESEIDQDALLALIYKHFDEKTAKALYFTRWKDSIDVEYPTVSVRNFAKAIVALSRAPQPDTVTEEMVEACLRAYHGFDEKMPIAHMTATWEQMRAALTAALSGKGK